MNEPETYGTYLFSRNNPWRWVDPTGEFSIGEMNAVQAGLFVLASIALPGLQSYKGQALGSSWEEDVDPGSEPDAVINDELGVDERDPDRWDVWQAVIAPGHNDIIKRGPISRMMARTLLMSARQKTKGSKPWDSTNTWTATAGVSLAIAPWPTIGPEIDKGPTNGVSGLYSHGGLRYCHFHDQNRAFNSHLFFGLGQRGPGGC